MEVKEIKEFKEKLLGLTIKDMGDTEVIKELTDLYVAIIDMFSLFKFSKYKDLITDYKIQSRERARQNNKVREFNKILEKNKNTENES